MGWVIGAGGRGDSINKAPFLGVPALVQSHVVPVLPQSFLLLKVPLSETDHLCQQGVVASYSDQPTLLCSPTCHFSIEKVVK